MVERNYIGVTGAATIDEIDHLSYSFNRFSRIYHLGIYHKPMIGILASTKTLLGEQTQNRRYPKVEEIPLLFRQVNYGFKVVHFNSREPSTLSKQLISLFKTGDLYNENLSRAVQLNNAWPPLDQIIETQKQLPDLKVVLQLNSQAMGKRSSGEIAQKVAGYGDMIHHVLIDPSGGRGKELEVGKVVPVYEAIKHRRPDLFLGFAGKLSGENVWSKCHELVSRIGHYKFSIDAESGVRDKLSEDYGNDLYSRDKVERYLEQAARFFSPDLR